MANERLFELLAEAYGQPSKTYQAFQEGFRGIKATAEELDKYGDRKEKARKRKLGQSTLSEILGGQVPAGYESFSNLPIETAETIAPLARFRSDIEGPVQVMTDEEALRSKQVPKGTKIVSTGQSDRSDRNALSGIRNQFLRESKEFSDISNRISNVISGAKDPSAAGDLSLIFSYMKMLDPSSTVREGEFATAANTGSVPDVLRGQYNKVISGERLAPNVRADFVGRSMQIYDGQKRNQRQRESEFKRLAAAQGLDPSQAIINMDVEIPKDAMGTNGSTGDQEADAAIQRIMASGEPDSKKQAAVTAIKARASSGR